MYITASKLYDYIQCPHKVWRDRYGPLEEMVEEANPFVELLWEKGILHEKEVIKNLGDYVDLSSGSIELRFKRTTRELRKGTPLIYQGVLIYSDLLGIPDLLKKCEHGSYIPVDIKSGSGYENGEKLKKHYAVQLCLYSELLKKYGFKKDNKAKIIDIEGKEVDYVLDEPQGVRNRLTWLDEYKTVLEDVRKLIQNKVKNEPALGGQCRLCPWYNNCKKWCEDRQDLSIIFGLGRSKRDIINSDLKIKQVKDISVCNARKVLSKKKKEKGFLKGIGKSNLNSIVNRANIIIAGKPDIYQKFTFPSVPLELFFDIEDDPTQDFIYLHGMFERQKTGKGKYIYFLAKENTLAEEERIWSEFWSYINSLGKGNFSFYYYSPHERTAFKKLLKKYPGYVSEKELDDFFESKNVIDLYQDAIFKYTDWPLWSYSLKDIATYLGFSWRDKTPSGALSIQWYNEYIKTGDPDIMDRILVYNEDDCRATMLIKDELEKMAEKKF